LAQRRRGMWSGLRLARRSVLRRGLAASAAEGGFFVFGLGGTSEPRALPEVAVHGPTMLGRIP
jgi:hypothetical protein